MPRCNDFIYFLLNLFLVEGYLLYIAVLVSAIQQCESAIGIHVLSLFSLPPTSLGCQRPQFEFLSCAAHSHWVSILRLVVCFHATLPTCPTLSFPPTLSTSLFSMSVSPLLPCKQVHQYHLSRFHIYALAYDVCFSDQFTLCDRF